VAEAQVVIIEQSGTVKADSTRYGFTAATTDRVSLTFQILQDIAAFFENSNYLWEHQLLKLPMCLLFELWSLS
jgi:hypothetical protein